MTIDHSCMLRHRSCMLRHRLLRPILMSAVFLLPSAALPQVQSGIRKTSNIHPARKVTASEATIDLLRAAKLNLKPETDAMKTKRTDAAEAALNNGADPNCVDSDSGGPPLISAIAMKNKPLTLLLLERGALPGLDDKHEQSPLFWAAWWGDAEIVTNLLNRGAHVNDRNELGQSPLIAAAAQGNLEVVQILLDHGANPLSGDYDDGADSITYARNRGHLELEEKLVAWVYRLPESSEQSRDLLEHVNIGDKAKVQAALEAGVAPDAVDPTERSSALSAAVFRGDVSVARVLLDHGADVRLTDMYGQTALHKAAGRGHLELVRLLIGRGADVDRQDQFGWTALRCALSNGQQDTATELLHRGADCSKADELQRTPLMAAAEKGLVVPLEGILARGASIDAADYSGWTALVYAAHNGRFDAVDVLLKHGADRDLASKNGTTALRAAERKGYSNIVALLKRPKQKN